DSAGNSDGGSGAQFGVLTILNTIIPDNVPAWWSTGANPKLLGNATATNTLNIVDADLTTYGEFSATGNGGINQCSLFIYGISGVTQRFNDLTLKVTASLVTNSLAPVGNTPTAF